MLCRKFELIPIKIVFFANFLSCSKIGPKTLYYKYRVVVQISSKMKRREFSIIITFSDIVFMLCRSFELIQIKTRFFMNF